MTVSSHVQAASMTSGGPLVGLTMTAPASPPSWTRRFSQSALPLPALPNISAFRAALLGYLGEVEASLQSDGKLPIASSVDDDHGGTSSAIAGPSSGLRNRNLDTPTSPLESTNSSLLKHLSSLREDVVAYLPSRLSVPVGPSREWLRSLPSKLSVVDLGVHPEHGEGQVRAAQRRVIEMVHTLLPSEEWAGWESLGWEDEESRAKSLTMDGDEEDEEPEYLFPNRTPASTKALASRRRAVRSKSLSLAWGSRPVPGKLVRSRTEPPRDSYFNMSPEKGDDDEAAEDEPDAAEVIESPELGDTKLTAAIAPSNLGPTPAEALARSEDGKRLIGYEDLPFVWRNNEHVIGGYRFIPLHGNAGPIPLIESAFAWHNETVNIHSHFIPTILILLAIPSIIYSSPLPNAHPLDTATLVIYLLAAVSCLVSSAGWHVLSGCASRRWFEWGACVDYIGISWLIAASFGTVVYNGYYCHPKTVLFYSTINGACGILGSYLPFQKWFNERKHKDWRIAFFLFLCFAMVAPMLQMFYLHGFSMALAFVSPFGLSIITYVTGLFSYAMHFPECFWPGKFDYWGSSHQIWHLAIVLAIILHYRAIFVAHSARYAYSCAIPDAGMPVGEVMEGLVRTVWASLRNS